PSRYRVLLPTSDWQRVLMLLVCVCIAPIVLLVFAPLIRIPIVIAAPLVTSKQARDAEAWWGILFLFDPATWRNIRRSETFLYLLYAGPYIVLMSSILLAVAIGPFHELVIVFTKHPGRLTPRESTLIFTIIW